jgi:peroxiredoxin
MKSALTIAAAAILTAVAAATPIDVGPAVGATVPPISAVTSQSEPATIASISAEKGVVLVFVRSAAWCPFCQKQLIELKDAQAPLATRGYALAAISYDDVSVLQDFAAEREVAYTLLSDKGSVTIDAFGLRDPQYPAGSKAAGVPLPSIFVLSPEGVVKAKLAEEGYKTRPPVSAILETIDALK